MTHSAMHKKNLKYLFRVMCKQSFVSKIDFDFFFSHSGYKMDNRTKGNAALFSGDKTIQLI